MSILCIQDRMTPHMMSNGEISVKQVQSGAIMIIYMKDNGGLHQVSGSGILGFRIDLVLWLIKCESEGKSD